MLLSVYPYLNARVRKWWRYIGTKSWDSSTSYPFLTYLILWADEREKDYSSWMHHWAIVHQTRAAAACQIWFSDTQSNESKQKEQTEKKTINHQIGNCFISLKQLLNAYPFVYLIKKTAASRCITISPRGNKHLARNGKWEKWNQTVSSVEDRVKN